MPDSRGETLFQYVGYATTRDIWQELKMGIVIWLFFSILNTIVLLPIMFGQKVLSVAPDLGVPVPFWFLAMVLFYWWFARGTTIHVPNVTVIELLLVGVVAAGCGALLLILGDRWLGVAYATPGIVLYTAERINRRGQHNYKLLHESESV